MIFVDEKTYSKKKVSLSQNYSSIFWDLKNSSWSFIEKIVTFTYLKAYKCLLLFLWWNYALFTTMEYLDMQKEETVSSF